MADLDDDEGGAPVSAAPFDPAERCRHASIQFYAQNQMFAQLRQLCTRELESQPSNPILEYWRCFALAKEGDLEPAIAGLDALLLRPDGSELGLPIVALLLSTHNSRAVKDKRTLLDLKARLKVVSKQSNEASLLLAGRYFLYTSKVPKARQCIEKLIAKNKKDVELLALFGWIYLLSGDDKYVEKSMQVFKKAAKLSLPNFDIAALMGRAKYFEVTRNVPKALQALESIAKIYPGFVPACEEKMRIAAVESRWTDARKLAMDSRNKRRAATGGAEEDSVTVAFVAALESFCTQPSPSQHATALAPLVRALARDEQEQLLPAGSHYWRWQYGQLFARLARADEPANPASESVWTHLDSLLTPALAASSGKAGPDLRLLFERGYLSLMRERCDQAAEDFAAVAAAPLVPEKPEKNEGEEEQGKDAAAAGAGAARYNEDERLQRALAHTYGVLALLGQNRLAEAAAAVETLPPDVALYAPAAPAGGSEPPAVASQLPSLLYAQAFLCLQHHGDAAAASGALCRFAGALAASMGERAPSEGVLATAQAGAVQGVNRYYLLMDPGLVVRAAALAARVLGVDPAALGSVASRPPSADQEPHAAALEALVALLRRLLLPTTLPGHAGATRALALLSWLRGDAEGATTALERCEELCGAGDAQVVQLRRLVAQLSAGAVPAASSSSAAAAPVPVAASFSPKVRPSKPLAGPAAAAVSGGAKLVGVGFDDDDDDDDEEGGGAAFKAAGDVDAEDADMAAKAAARAARAARDAQAELEAQAELDELESRAGASSSRKAGELRATQASEAARLAREAERKKQREEEVRKAAEAEAAAALEKTSKAEQRIAEQRREAEIAALRLAREAERKRQQEEAEREREAERAERERQRAAAAAAAHGTVTEVTAVQAFDDGSDGDDAGMDELDSRAAARRPQQQQPSRPQVNTAMKWNFPADAGGPSASPPAGRDTPLSLMQSPQGNERGLASPLAAPSPSVSFQRPLASPMASPTAAASASSSASSAAAAASAAASAAHAASPSPAPSPTAASSAASAPSQLSAQQLAHARQLEQQRSEESRLLAEKKDKIMQAGLQIDQAKKFTKVAFWGEVFLKHGRRGSPHERNVTLEVTGSELKFDWSSGQLKAHKNDIQLVEGKGTPVFARTTADKTPAHRCFSIVTATRTLDLEAPSDQVREYWVTGIKLLLKYLK